MSTVARVGKAILFQSQQQARCRLPASRLMNQPKKRASGGVSITKHLRYLVTLKRTQDHV